jgi:hypothetical protein
VELLDLVKLIEEDKPFQFARYGDGEWKVVFGSRGSNCDKHKYNIKNLRQDMDKSIKGHHPYFYGMQGLATRRFPEAIKTYLKGIVIPWIDADMFHLASAKGRLNPFVQALREKRLCFIGPPHLINNEIRTIDRIENVFIFVRNENCYLDKERVKKKIEMLRDQFDIFLFSAGFLSNILIWELYPSMKDKWMIDVGSLWDPYCGIDSRTYHKKITKEITQRNFA